MGHENYCTPDVKLFKTDAVYSDEEGDREEKP